MAEHTLGDQFEQLLAEGKLSFQTATLEELDGWGRAVVQMFLRPEAGISWLLGEPKIGPAYCLKLSDPFLQYLDIYPQTQQFQWCSDDHHTGVHPDEALAYLLAKSLPGAQVQSIRDEQTGLRRLRLVYLGQVIQVDDRRERKLPGDG